MTTIDTVVIGAGHAGLAVSRLLSSAGRDHVVLDRGRVGERWRTERWDSLHLLTPSWMTRLPGWTLPRPGPRRVPVRRRVRRPTSRSTPPRSARRSQGGTTGRGRLAVTGRCDAGTPSARTGAPGSARQRRRRHRTARSSRTCPAGLGARTVRGTRQRVPQPRHSCLRAASWSSEPRPPACRSPTSSTGPGREVVLAVGRPHPDAAPLPRHGHLLVAGAHRAAGAHHRRDARPGTTPAASPRCSWSDATSSERQAPTRRPGRAPGPWRAAGRPLRRGPPIARHVSATTSPRRSRAADARLHRFLDARRRPTSSGSADFARSGGRSRPPPVRAAEAGHPARPARRGDRSTIVAATGYRPHHPWLRLPVSGRTGRIQQRRGVTASPGLYVVGQRVPAPPRLRLHRRRPARRRDVVAHLLNT